MEKNTDKKINNDKYRVIEIVNDKKILINYGIYQGAEVGDKIEIYEDGRKVIDPISHRDLGNWDYIKDTLSITQVFHLFSVCSKTVTKNPQKEEEEEESSTVVESLIVDEKSITNAKFKTIVGDR
jgi:hypothetical protein